MPENIPEMLAEGESLERQGRYREAWLTLAHAGELKQPPRRRVWAGPGSPASDLLVKRRIRHLGAELRNARFAALAREHVPVVTVATEERLLALLGRSFPDVDYVDAKDGRALPADCETSYERLASHFGDTEGAIAASFRPLVPPATGSPTGIGIAWHSTSARKDLPPVEHWGEIVRTLPGPIQSLQYDESQAGIEHLEDLAGKAIRRSPIDQRVDIDGFAASVASVRGVLTISSTTAHMAGALGKACVVVVDDLNHLSWPLSRDRTPFYPNLRLVRRQGRDWQIALAEAADLLDHLIEQA